MKMLSVKQQRMSVGMRHHVTLPVQACLLVCSVPTSSRLRGKIIIVTHLYKMYMGTRGLPPRTSFLIKSPKEIKEHGK